MEYTVCIDFGTTFSSVSCHRQRAATPGDNNSIHILQGHHEFIRPVDLIKIGNYPNAPKVGKLHHTEVPTELLVRKANGKTEWGWTVHKYLRLPSETEYIRLHKFKLLLDEREHIQAGRTEYSRGLEMAGYSRDEAIYTYLHRLLGHTQAELAKHYGFSHADSVQLVASVPAIWNSNADMVMSKCLSRAAQDLQFGHEHDVHLVAEPDAAATFFCHNERSDFPFLDIGDVFAICDCGGGTVDLVTYRFECDWPPRINEVVAGEGDLCGSSYVDKAYFDWLKGKLMADKRYSVLADDNGGIKKVAGMATVDFEAHTKRNFGPNEDQVLLMVPGAPAFDGANTGTVVENGKTIEALFQPHLQRIAQLIRSQIQSAVRAGEVCKKILMVGGFCTSAYLQDFMEKTLTECNLKFPDTPGTAVSDGGIIRYLNRHHGPQEVMRASYGFLRTEEHNPDRFEGHREGNCVPVIDEEDGKPYVRDCMAYFVQKGQVIPPGGKTFDSADYVKLNGGKLERTFSNLDQDLVISLEIFENTSLENVKNNFEKDHALNKGYVSLGLLEWTIPKDHLRQYVKNHGYRFVDGRRKRYYYINYGVKFQKNGRTIRYELWFEGARKALGLCHAHTATTSPTLEDQIQLLEV